MYEHIEISFFENSDDLLIEADKFCPDKILIHFYHSWMLDKLIKKVNIPIFIWVHGYEALGWYRRLFNYSWPSPVLLNYINENTLQQYNFRKMIHFANQTQQIKFVFVSDWMKRITEWDTLSKIKKHTIIPNPVDTVLFKYEKKNPVLRKNILLIRSFTTKKYANDISVKAILLLAKKPFFDELKFTIIGTGALFKILTEPLRKFSNIDLQERAVRQINIPELHLQNGIFLCPTRQDAQGVSMCEAMSSGLVPVTSNNTAIPEFVRNQETGFFANNAKDIVDAIELTYNNPELFQLISQQAAASIRQKCSIQTIISKELNIIDDYVK